MAVVPVPAGVITLAPLLPAVRSTGLAVNRPLYSATTAAVP